MESYWRVHDDSLLVTGKEDAELPLQLQPFLVELFITVYRDAIRDYRKRVPQERRNIDYEMAAGEKAIANLCKVRKADFGKYCSVKQYNHFIYETMFDEEFPPELRILYTENRIYNIDRKAHDTEFKPFYKAAVKANDLLSKDITIRQNRQHDDSIIGTMVIVDGNIPNLSKEVRLIYARLLYLRKRAFPFQFGAVQDYSTGKEVITRVFNHILDNSLNIFNFIDRKGLIFDDRRFIDAVLSRGPNCIDNLLTNSFDSVKIASKQAPLLVDWRNALSRAIANLVPSGGFNKIPSETYIHLARKFPSVLETKIGMLSFLYSFYGNIQSLLDDEDKSWFTNLYVEKFPNLSQEDFYTDLFTKQTPESDVLYYDHIPLELKKILFTKATTPAHLVNWADGLVQYRKLSKAKPETVEWFSRELRRELSAIGLPEYRIAILLGESQEM